MDHTIQDLAYCAGVIDSDGTIGVKMSTYAMRHGNGGQPNYSERICVKQVEPQAVDLLTSLFGGSRYISKPSAKKGRALFSWQVTDQQAASALRAILPFLRIKRPQAENCLRLREIKEESKRVRVSLGRGHVGSARRTQEHGDAMAETARVARLLNRVGV